MKGKLGTHVPTHAYTHSFVLKSLYAGRTYTHQRLDTGPVFPEYPQSLSLIFFTSFSSTQLLPITYQYQYQYHRRRHPSLPHVAHLHLHLRRPSFLNFRPPFYHKYYYHYHCTKAWSLPSISNIKRTIVASQILLNYSLSGDSTGRSRGIDQSRGTRARTTDISEPPLSLSQVIG